MNEFYTINDIATMTGLTTRTIRNYMKLGMLEGEKVEGVWQFSAEAAFAFMADKNVQPSIQANKISYRVIHLVKANDIVLD